MRVLTKLIEFVFGVLPASYAAPIALWSYFSGGNHLPLTPTLRVPGLPLAVLAACAIAGALGLWMAFLYRPAALARRRLLGVATLAALLAGTLAATWLVATHFLAQPAAARSAGFVALLAGPIAVGISYLAMLFRAMRAAP